MTEEELKQREADCGVGTPDEDHLNWEVGSEDDPETGYYGHLQCTHCGATKPIPHDWFADDYDY